MRHSNCYQKQARCLHNTQTNHHREVLYLHFFYSKLNKNFVIHVFTDCYGEFCRSKKKNTQILDYKNR